jgi:hypothetical protein
MTAHIHNARAVMVRAASQAISTEAAGSPPAAGSPSRHQEAS